MANRTNGLEHTNRALALCEELDQLAADREQLEARIDALRADLKSTLQHIKDELTEQEIRSLVHTLYWDRDDIPVALLYDLAGTHAIAKVAGPHTISIVCTGCGGEFEATVRSKSARQELLKTKTKGYRFAPNLCKDCQRVRQLQQEARHHAHIEWATAATVKYKMRLEELRQMPYQEYLQTPEWQTTRKRALKRAGYRCQLCNSNGCLHVHHNDYSRLGEEDNVDLVVLCATCHARYHEVPV